MLDLFYKALDMANIGIIIINQDLNIIFWNLTIEKIANLNKADVLNKKIYDVCPTFQKQNYANILQQALFHGQSRFCSSVLHKAFIYPIETDLNGQLIRQNMKVEPIYLENEQFALIQIMDITDHFDNEVKMKTMLNTLSSAYETVKISEETAKQLACYDPLTNLLNRCGLADDFTATINNLPEKEKLVILFLDLDGFKKINDDWGHDSGDLLLQCVAQRLKTNLRETDIISRRGGDEFCLILKNIKDVHTIPYIAQKLVTELGRPYELPIGKVTVSSSIGISIYPDDGNDLEELISKADTAMYHIKKSGKNFFSFYNSSK